MTQQNDLGYTELLDQHNVPKYDLRVELLGTLDEASSVLGVVRATTANEQTKTTILEIPHDLCWMMSELAATTEEARPEIHITTEREQWLAGILAKLRTEAGTVPAYTAPEDSPSSSFTQLARAVVSRAERQVKLLHNQGVLHNIRIIAYLNQLSAFLFLLAGYENKAQE